MPRSEGPTPEPVKAYQGSTSLIQGVFLRNISRIVTFEALVGDHGVVATSVYCEMGSSIVSGCSTSLVWITTLLVAPFMSARISEGVLRAQSVKPEMPAGTVKTRAAA